MADPLNWWEKTQNWWATGSPSMSGIINPGSKGMGMSTGLGAGRTASNIASTKNAGGWFSKANAAGTAKAAGAISLGLNALAAVFDKSKPGQPAPTYTAAQSMGRPDDWSHFFSSSSRIG